MNAVTTTATCPSCGSPAPHRHPAVQHEGEVQPCRDEFHLTVTSQNTPERIAKTQALFHAFALRDLACGAPAFAEEVLSPDRCTRSLGGRPHYDPVRDREHLIPGDEVLVDVSAYNHEVEPLQWCRVLHLAPGSAAVYPYKVQVPGRGDGQYRADEVLAWRRPVSLHQTLLEAARMSAR